MISSTLKFTMRVLILTFFLMSLVQCIGSTVKKDITLHDGATLVKTTDYNILGSGTGEDSAFYILGMIPVTKAPNTELALSQVLEKYPNGKTLINIKIQREDRAYFPLGLVTLVRVTADVVGDPNEFLEKDKDKK